MELREGRGISWGLYLIGGCCKEDQCESAHGLTGYSEYMTIGRLAVGGQAICYMLLATVLKSVTGSAVRAQGSWHSDCHGLWQTSVWLTLPKGICLELKELLQRGCYRSRDRRPSYDSGHCRFVGGLIATVTVTIMVTRIARRAITALDSKPGEGRL